MKKWSEYGVKYHFGKEDASAHKKFRATEMPCGNRDKNTRKRKKNIMRVYTRPKEEEQGSVLK